MISPQWLSELRRLWPNVPRQVACELVSRQLPTLCLHSSIVSPLRLRWVKGVRVFRCSLHCWQNYRGLLRDTAVTREQNGHRIPVKQVSVVSASGSNSKLSKFGYGVPQGSVLGPILFVLYTKPMSKILSNHTCPPQFFADDTQLRKSCSSEHYDTRNAL